MADIPSEPFMLLSFVNMKLRDGYESPEELCASLGIDADELVRTLHEAGFDYVPAINQFR
mgnify:CR=1 FL=1